MDFEKVARGIVSYIDKEIFPKMTTLQDFAGRIAVSRIYNGRAAIKETIRSNPVFKSIVFSDDSDEVDIEGLVHDIKAQLEKKGSIVIEIPMFGKFTFVGSDIDTLHRYIMEA